jgi:hypothetical protein
VGSLEANAVIREHLDFAALNGILSQVTFGNLAKALPRLGEQPADEPVEVGFDLRSQTFTQNCPGVPST